ncbi:MAG TPA: DUF5011 domain-containing protein [Puia sp.]|nr:DUF5011 domain-containing protein [Puia sp.]
MKYKIAVLFPVFAFILLSACNKYTVHNTDDQVGISKVTHYVVLTVKGDPFVSIVAGEDYVDSGATALENGEPVDYTVSGSVDNSTPGIYTITYTAVNKDGYSSSTHRNVAVLPEAEQPGIDLSGTYANVGTAALTANISKVAPGVYYTDNCWGGGSLAIVQAYFFCTDGVNVTFPYQQFSGYGHLDGAGTYNAGLLSWTVTLEDLGVVGDKKWQKQ